MHFTRVVYCSLQYIYFFGVGKYSADERSCNRVVSGVQVCSGALAVWEQLLGCILWYRSALSFVVGILLYGWWL